VLEQHQLHVSTLHRFAEFDEQWQSMNDYLAAGDDHMGLS
jgi:hypothetical protein